MNTNLLDKFAAVEVAADTRIDPADRNFCQTQQDAYHQARTALKELSALWEKHHEEQKSILRRAKEEVYATYFGNLDSDEFHRPLKNTHERFISELFRYFERKYAVDLSDYDAKKALLPEEPSCSYWTPNTEAFEEYEKAMTELSLTYQQVLDQIFLQLGGLSFEDKATKEIKDAAHAAAWNTSNGNRNFEQKKAVISFSYGCSFDSWWEQFHKGEEHHIQFLDSIKNVMKAIIHFEYGNTDYTPLGLLNLMGYDWQTKDTESQVNTDRLQSVKCFKNGRVDFRFTSEGYARQFIEEYLGTTL